VPEQSLKEFYPRHFEIPSMLIVSMVTLICGLFLPVITLEEMVFWKHTFSVLTGIWSLFTEGHYILGAIVLLFSVIFPVSKLVMLFSLWFRDMSEQRRRWYVHWLSIMGKWSMLDVFVVAMTIVVAKISNFAKAEPRLGIYFFGTSIALAILATMRMEFYIGKKELVPQVPQ
jgi:paraquat-inducible protein A